MKKILVIDDEPGIRTVLADILSDDGYKVFTAEEGISGIALIRNIIPDLVILDVWLPGRGGIDILADIQQEYPEMPVIVISGHGNIDTAVKAVKMGAFDFLEKPLSLEKVSTLCRNAVEVGNLRLENQRLKSSKQEDPLIGSSSALNAIREQIVQSADSDAKVLITGENGTGKDLVAREIHLKSSRKDRPFVELNCAAIPENLLESELFGHEKGAFTGALSKRRGKFELAHTGTLFLDEIGDMAPGAQAKVLRAVQQMCFERVGGEETISVDVRIIAATNRSLTEEIAAGRFREDLYFRLNVIPIHLPPLRERTEDLPELINWFAEKYKPESLPKPREISPETMELLCSHPWHGNIRELKNFMERINIMCDNQVIKPGDALMYLGENSRTKTEFSIDRFLELSFNESRDLFEMELLVYHLEKNKYSISKTAESIGLYPSNLHGKIKKHRIGVKK